MPLYEYKREDGSTFEVIQKVSDKILEVCPETGQKVKRLMSPSNAHFKGSGFYQTDYNGKSASNKSSSEKSEKKDDSSSKNKEKKTPCGSGCGCH